jgi:hypothetical protein
MENIETIEIRSLKFVEKINKHNGMTALTKIDADRADSLLRPIFYFHETANVQKAVDEFFDEYEHDDRSMDDWTGFNSDEFYRPKDTNIIVTRNIHIVNTLIDSGYSIKLCAAYKEKVGTKTAYKFLANDEIRKIKADGDAESKRYYEAKMKDKDSKH